MGSIPTPPRQNSDKQLYPLFVSPHNKEGLETLSNSILTLIFSTWTIAAHIPSLLPWTTS